MTLKGRRKRNLDFYFNTSFLNSVHMCSPVFPVNKNIFLKFFLMIFMFFCCFFACHPGQNLYWGIRETCNQLGMALK